MPFKKPHHTSENQYQDEHADGYEIKPRGLNIVWGNDSRYWKIPENGPAELIQVSWLEVSCELKNVKVGNYKISFNVKVKDDGFGWTGTDILVMAKVGKTGRYAYKPVTLSLGESDIPTESLKIEVKETHQQKDLHFGLYEVWSGKWKGGLEIIKAVVKRENTR